MADSSFTVGSISSFLQEHGEDLPEHHEKDIESSSDEEVDEEFELRLQLALREQITGGDGKPQDWMERYENDSAEEDEEDDAADEQQQRREGGNGDADEKLGARQKAALTQGKGEGSSSANSNKGPGDDDEEEEEGDASDDGDTSKQDEPAAKKPRKVPKPQAPPQKHVAASTSVYVGNLPFSASEDELRVVFAAKGSVEKVVIERNSKGKSKGFGYVEYSAADGASAAVADLHDKAEVGGRKLLVRPFDGEVAKRHVVAKQNQRKAKVKRNKRRSKAVASTAKEESSSVSESASATKSDAKSQPSKRHRKDKKTPKK